MRRSIYDDSRWKALRLKALRRAGWKCESCGANVRGKGLSRVDHKQSVAAAPELAFELDNLRVLCGACDNARHSEKGGGRAIGRQQLGLDGFPIDS